MRTVALCTLVFGFFAVLGFAAAVVFGVLRDSRHRGEVAEAPLPDPDPFNQDAGRFVGRAPVLVPLPDVPEGTGEQLARELTDYLKGNR